MLALNPQNESSSQRSRNNWQDHAEDDLSLRRNAVVIYSTW